MTRTVIQLRVSPEEKKTLDLRGNISSYIRSCVPELRTEEERLDALAAAQKLRDAEPPVFAPKPVEKPRDPQPESDYRVQRRAGLKQRKL